MNTSNSDLIYTTYQSWLQMNCRKLSFFLWGQYFYQVQLNIDANSVSIVLPLPGNRAEVARSVERDAVWWIGFSWSSEWKSFPRRRAGFSAAKSCYRIRPCLVLSAPSTYGNIFSHSDGKNQGWGERKVIHSSSQEVSIWLYELLFVLTVHFCCSCFVSLEVFFQLTLIRSLCQEWCMWYLVSEVTLMWEV